MQRKKKGRWYALPREKCSKAAYRQETWKVQQKRKVVKGKFGELSKC